MGDLGAALKVELYEVSEGGGAVRQARKLVAALQGNLDFERSC